MRGFTVVDDWFTFSFISLREKKIVLYGGLNLYEKEIGD